MNKEHILDSWQKSEKIPRLPEYLQEIIRICFHNTVQEKSKALLDFLELHLEAHRPILETNVFSTKKPITTPEDFFLDRNIDILRNLALMEWFAEGKFFDILDQIEDDVYKQESFISAYTAFCLSKLLLLQNPQNAFLLSCFKDIGLVILARTFPSLFNGVNRLSGTDRFEPVEQAKIIGVYPGELSAWILQKWGFPEEFLLPLKSGKLMGDQNTMSGVIYFSRYISDFILNGEIHVKYKTLENLFYKLFNRNARDLQDLLVELIRILPQQASFFGYQQLEDLTIIEILKDHLDIFDKDLLSYNDLREEVMKAHRRLRKQAKEIYILRDQLEKNYIKDSITGLYNHIYLREFLLQKIREASRYEYPITLLVFDIDNFKAFNRDFGYAAGNELLKQVARLVTQNIRQSDILARYGGDEFAIVFPYTGLPHSRAVAEKIANLISTATFEDSFNYKAHQLTISIGFASILPEQSLDIDEKLISLVIKALRQSQKTGGNSITQATA
ncbi:MAG: GGDEF domain-containing protein [Calditrichaeota bacterium]|nr:diguanylate cyclase [Calditrichota bacterium]RQW02368.1 MAG: GGDEF domain-containing protein [Calditrichota bacterium]